jgi:hypothetical protein
VYNYLIFSVIPQKSFKAMAIPITNSILLQFAQHLGDVEHSASVLWSTYFDVIGISSKVPKKWAFAGYVCTNGLSIGV